MHRALTALQSAVQLAMGFYPDDFPDLSLGLFLPDQFFFGLSLTVGIAIFVKDYISLFVEVSGRFWFGGGGRGAAGGWVDAVLTGSSSLFSVRDPPPLADPCKRRAQKSTLERCACRSLRAPGSLSMSASRCAFGSRALPRRRCDARSLFPPLSLWSTSSRLRAEGLNFLPC